jgi:hypothetical protein
MADDKDKTEATLNIGLLVIAIVYIIVIIFSIMRIVKVSMTKNAIKIAIAFYCSMLTASLARAITLYFVSGLSTIVTDETKTGDAKTNFLFYLFMVIPDMLNIGVFLFLSWYYFAHFILSHINLANDLHLFTKHDVPEISKKTYIFLYITITAYTITYLILCILQYTRQFNEQNTIFIINSIFDLGTPCLVVGYYIYLLIKFSGRPYIHDKAKEQSKKIFWVVVFWSMARIV